MRDDEGRIYHIVHTKDIIDSHKTLGVSEVSASYVKGDTELLPGEDYGFLHPTFQISTIYNDEGEKTGFSKIRFAGYPIVWEKITKIKGRRFKKVKVYPEDADKYFERSEEDYRKYQEDYKTKKAESRYVVASTTHWEYSNCGVRKSVRTDLSVGRIDGAYYYSPDISERKKRVSANSFRVICEIDPLKQDEARSIIRVINDYEKDLITLDSIDYRAKNLRVEGRGGDLEILLKFKIQRTMRDFVREQREECGKHIDKLIEELKELGSEPEETGEVEEGSEQ